LGLLHASLRIAPIEGPLLSLSFSGGREKWQMTRLLLCSAFHKDNVTTGPAPSYFPLDKLLHLIYKHKNTAVDITLQKKKCNAVSFIAACALGGISKWHIT